MKKVKVLKPVLVSNKQRAKENRKAFDRMSALVINIISSPGAGKTSVIERIAAHFQERFKILIIEGDIRGQYDSERLARLSIDVMQINTASECHLDAFMIAQLLPKIKTDYDLIIVENVGNLVCPAEFEIGEDFKLAILSTPEGDDKPLKYPLLFHVARVILINKIDLLSHVDFRVRKAHSAIRKENPRARIFDLSAKTAAGFKSLLSFIARELHAKKAH